MTIPGFSSARGIVGRPVEILSLGIYCSQLDFLFTETHFSELSQWLTEDKVSLGTVTSLGGYGPKDGICYTVRNDIAFNHVQTHELILNRTGLRSSVLYSKLKGRGGKDLCKQERERSPNRNLTLRHINYN